MRVESQAVFRGLRRYFVGQRRAISTLIACVWLVGSVARADFVPGRLYITVTPAEPGPSKYDMIYEFDPLTGGAREFWRAPVGQSNNLVDLAFTPDGSGLRGAFFWESNVGQYAGDGTLSPVFGPSNGVQNPYGITYGRNGEFFVSQYNEILQFQPGATQGSIFADAADGVTGVGALAVAPNGDVYYAQGSGGTIVRMTNEGIGSPFATLSQGGHGIGSMAVDSHGNLLVLAESGLYRFNGGDPATQRRISVGAAVSSFANIRFSADETVLYEAEFGSIYADDPVFGYRTFLGTLPLSQTQWYPGTGLAVYVPEPSATPMLCFAVALLRHSMR